MTHNRAMQLPPNRSKRLRRYARTAKIGSYVAPALATAILFFAKNDPILFWWAAGALFVSIALQLAKDWWEKILSARRRPVGPDGRSLDIVLAQQALTSAGQMSAGSSRRSTLSICREHLVKSLAREYEEWEGSAATLYLTDKRPTPFEHISASIGKPKPDPPYLAKGLEYSGQDGRAILQSTSAGSLILVPVCLTDRTWGVLTLHTSEEHFLSPKDVEIVRDYASMLALTFEVERSSN